MHKFNVICYTGAESIVICTVVSNSQDKALVEGKECISSRMGLKPDQYLFKVFAVKDF